MSFDLNRLNTVSSGGRRGLSGGPTLYAYNSPDTAEVTSADGYFNPINDRLDRGDMLFVRIEQGSPHSEIYVVTVVEPDVILGEKFLDSTHVDGFSFVMNDLSTTDSTFLAFAIVRRIIRIDLIISTGSITTNPTIIIVELDGTPITTVSPISIPAGSVPGDKVGSLVVGSFETGGNEVIEVLSDGGSTTAAAGTVFVGTEVIPRSD